MVDTIKFSQMTDGGDIDNNKKVPGLKDGGNVLFNNPWTFLPSGTTAQRPTPSAEINFRLRFNTEVQLYEYYDAVLGAWTQLQESASTVGPFITYTADVSLPDAQNLGALSDGILKQTITLGVATLDIAVQGTDYYGPGDNATFSGLTMTGDIDMGGFKAINAADPVDPQDYATKFYVDTIAAFGVTSLEGTANQVLVNGTSGTPQTGVLTVTTPQDIATSSSPEFVDLTLSGTSLLDGTGGVLLGLSPQASPVNYLQIRNAPAGGNPVLQTQGATALIPMLLQPKGGEVRLHDNLSTTGARIRLFNAGASQSTSFGVASGQATTVDFTVPATDLAGVMASNGAGVLSLTRNPYLDTVVGGNAKTVLEINDNSASAVNYIGVGNNITANAPAVQAKGTDTNISLDLKGKGTGGAMVQGVSTNSNASAGYVGELISSTVLGGSAVALTTGTPADITSISLTAGDWDVSGVICFTGNAATTVTSNNGWISTTSATLPTPPNSGSFYTDQTSRTAGNTILRISVGKIRISIASTTTVYLSGSSAFAVNSYSAFGFIGARRVR